MASAVELLRVIRIEARVIGGDKRAPTFEAIERPGAEAARQAREAAQLARATARLGRRHTKAREAP